MKNQENFDFDKYLSYKKSNADTTENTEEAPQKEEKKKKPFKFPSFKFPVKPKNEEVKEEEKPEISVQNEEKISDNTNSKENSTESTEKEEITETVREEVKEEKEEQKEEIPSEKITLTEEDKAELEENIYNPSAEVLTFDEEETPEKNEELPPEQEENKAEKDEKPETSDDKVQNEETIEIITISNGNVEEKKPSGNDNTSSRKKKKNKKNKKRNKNNKPDDEVKAEKKPLEDVLDVVKDEANVEKIQEIPQTSTEEKQEVTIIADAFKDKKEETKEEKPKENKRESEKKNIIKDAFGKALDEDIAELNSVKVQDDAAVHYIPKKTKKPFFVIGIIVLIMTIVGLVSTVVGMYNVIWDFANNTKQKEELANYLYPVVMTDPAMFDNPMQLTSEAICKAAIWDIILHDDISKYPHEYGNITIPEQDVEHHATKLFGTGLKFDHKNLGDVSLMFYYNPEKKSYTVPESPKFFSYSPNVEEIQKTAQDELNLLVAYISPSPAWLIQDPDDNSNVGKHMVYVLGITDNGYVIKEIKEPENKEPLM